MRTYPRLREDLAEATAECQRLRQASQALFDRANELERALAAWGIHERRPSVSTSTTSVEWTVGAGDPEVAAAQRALDRTKFPMTVIDEEHRIVLTAVIAPNVFQEIAEAQVQGGVTGFPSFGHDAGVIGGHWPDGPARAEGDLRDLPIHGFGWALDELACGHAIARVGWNARHRVELERPPNETMTEPFLVIHAHNGEVRPWLASQADILAADWQRVVL